MTKKAKREYINEMRPRYLAAPKHEQTVLLDEMIKLTRWNRKYLIRVLHQKPDPVYPKAVVDHTAKPTPGRPKEYHAPAILVFLLSLWIATGQACGKRLQSIIPLWLPYYETPGNEPEHKLSLEHQVLLTRISAATIDRLLAAERTKHRIGKGRSTTKPGTLLKHQIPIKTDQWTEKRPGFLEIDTVAHCGNSLSGMFVYSLDSVDLATSWTQVRAAWGKGEIGIRKAFQEIEEALPFRLRGMDSDNGGEFINRHMQTYLIEGRRRKVHQTRSRPYKKNDNAHIEQKNWTHVRQLFGYSRFDNPEVVALMNDLYRNEHSLLTNYFLPSVKLQEKERIGSKIVKRHDAPLTPVDRILAMRSIPDDVKDRLRSQRDALNPFHLARELERKRKIILAMATLSAPSPQLLKSIVSSPTKNQRSTARRASLPERAPASPTKPGCPAVRKSNKILMSKNDGNR